MAFVVKKKQLRSLLHESFRVVSVVSPLVLFYNEDLLTFKIVKQSGLLKRVT